MTVRRKIRLTLCLSLMTFLASKSAFAEPAQLNATPIDVIATKVALITVPEELSAIGHMRAIRSVDLSFQVSGNLTSIFAQSGHRVNQGDVIAKLDDQSDQAQLTSSQAADQLAKSTYERTLEVEKYGGISEQQVDEAREKMVAAESIVQEQRVLINNKQLKAPFSGVLGSFQFSPGAYLAAGTSLVSLVQEAPLMVEYSIPASQRAVIEIGQTVSITSSAYPDKKFSGILTFISPDVDRNTGTLLLQAKVPNDDYLLLPGMFVNVQQVLNPNRQLLMIPDISLLTDIQGEYVFKVVGTSVQKTHVEVGLISKDLAEIKSGLSANDIIVMAGQQKLDTDSVIHVLSPNASALPESSGGDISGASTVGSQDATHPTISATT